MNPPTMLYGLNDKPPFFVAALVGFQHLLAVFGGIVASPLIIALGMGLDLVQTSYLVSASLLVSGLATFIQIQRLGPIGSGLLSIQGTSFTFIGPLIAAYAMLRAQSQGMSSEQALGVIFGTCAVCAFIIGIAGQAIEKLQRIITPSVTGATVILIGMSLLWSSAKNLQREYAQNLDAGGSGWTVLLLALFVFGVTLLVSRHKRPFVRIFGVTAGLVAGSCVATFAGLVDFSRLKELEPVFLPSISHFPLAFDLQLFFILLPVFVISSLETIGDLTATCSLSSIDLKGREYWRRIRGGITGDAFNSLLAAILCSFPNTSFSQNNGVIRLTGVSSRYVGAFTAVMLFMLGLFPIIGGLFIVIPGAVLYGATTLLFMMVLFSGIGIVRMHTGDPARYWVAGLAVAGGWLLALLMPQLKGWVPDWLIGLLAFPISTGACLAMLIEAARGLYGSPVGRRLRWSTQQD